MRVAVFGGSFHPPHVGHAMVASWLLWTEQVEAVWLLPVGDHPFGKALAPFAHRVRWCAALAGVLGPGVRVEAIEGERAGPTYTIDTLDALAARHPEHRFQLVVGADVLPATSSWRSWDRIVAAYAPIVVGRAGYPPAPGAPVFPDVSSTQIRARLEAGEPVNGLVPAAVIRALRETGPWR